MAESANKNNKNLIIGICAAVAVIVVLIVAIILIPKGGQQLSDSYFVSDSTKYVLSVENDTSEDGEISPIKTHMVYFYSGDSITGVKIYYEFASTDDAKTAYDTIKSSDESSAFQSIELNGKYVILTSPESEYAELKASDVKQQIEFMEMLQNMNLEDTTEEEAE